MALKDSAEALVDLLSMRFSICLWTGGGQSCGLVVDPEFSGG